MWNRTIAIGILAATAVLAQNNARLRNTFETGDEGWIAIGPGAKVHVTAVAGKVKNGKSALAYEYELVPKKFSAAVLPVTDGLAGMRRLRFWNMIRQELHQVPLREDPLYLFRVGKL
jgi:hypothetical protein